MVRETLWRESKEGIGVIIIAEEDRDNSFARFAGAHPFLSNALLSFKPSFSIVPARWCSAHCRSYPDLPSPAHHRLHKGEKEGVRTVGPALEFRMELRSEHERMVPDLDDFHELGLRPLPGEDEPLLFEFPAERVIELVAVPVPLGDRRVLPDLPRTPVRLLRLRPLLQFAPVRAEAERPPLRPARMLPGQEVHDVLAPRERSRLIELLTRKLRILERPPRVLDGEDLCPETEPQVRDLLRPRVMRREDFALDAADAESAGNDDPRAGTQLRPRLRILRFEQFAVDPRDLRLAPAVHRGGLDRLEHAQIGILEVRVLPDERDPHLPRRPLVPRAPLHPRGHVRREITEPEFLPDDGSHGLLLVLQGYVVYRMQIRRADHGCSGDAAEPADLLEEILLDARLLAPPGHVPPAPGPPR